MVNFRCIGHEATGEFRFANLGINDDFLFRSDEFFIVGDGNFALDCHKSGTAAICNGGRHFAFCDLCRRRVDFWRKCKGAKTIKFCLFDEINQIFKIVLQMIDAGRIYKLTGSVEDRLKQIKEVLNV